MGNNYHHYNKNKKKKTFIDESYVPPYDKGLLGQSIDILKLSDVVKEKLLKGNVNTIFDVVRRCEKDFYRIPTFDKRNLGELKSALNNKRLRLKPMDEQKKEGEKVEKKEEQSSFHKKEFQKSKEQNQPSFSAQQISKENNRDKKKANDKRQNQQIGRANDNKQVPKQGKFDKKFREDISEARTKEEREKLRPKRETVVHPQDVFIKINKNGKWGFATRDGKEVIAPEYDEVYLFHEDLCCVEVGDKFGFINREGKVVVPIVYDCALSFSEGYACVYKGDNCGYVDSENNVVIPFEFDAGTPVVNGEVRVKRLGQWGELHFDNPSEIRWIV